MKKFLIVVLMACASCLAQNAPPRNYPEPKSGDFTASGFRFKSGEQIDVKLHYYTLGTPARDAAGRVTNAVLILHGTGGSGRQFLSNNFAGVLFNPGQLLDAAKYFIVLPDNVGHGQSSKPSDGLRMGFPHYDYDDMVALQHELLVRGLGVDHLRLVMGTSMGCMHSWVWTETYPDFMDAAMPLACLPVEIAGRNRIWRKMLMDGIRSDPAWNNGNYTEQPKHGLLLAEDLLILAGSAPIFNHTQAPTRDTADRLLELRLNTALKTLDANDLLYQVDASRNYNPDPKLETIRVPVMAVNSADDFINPPELGILRAEVGRVKRSVAVVLPITDQTRGHGTHTLPAIWGNYLAELLTRSGGLAPGTSFAPPPLSIKPLAPTGAPIPGLQTSSGAPVYRVGPGITPPTATYKPDPPYPEAARQRKFSGTVVLVAIVGPDGLVQDARVQTSSDPSLDQTAIDTIKTWRFQPATKDGQPLAVQVSITTDFRTF